MSSEETNQEGATAPAGVDGGVPSEERITKNPLPSEEKKEKKAKDPKKVAAGKKLAEANKRAREAQKREEEREAEREASSPTPEGDSWLPEISFTTVLSMVGIGLTVFQLFQRSKLEDPDRSLLRAVHTKIGPTGDTPVTTHTHRVP